MERKTFAAEIKAIEDDGTVKAYIATYRSTPDHDNDIIEPGAFTKSLSGSPRIPMLWQHDTKSPCGHWYAYQTEGDGVLATGKFNLATDWGRNAHGAVKGGDIDTFSIGYLTEKATYDTKGVRHLQELNLKEASPVTFAADDAAKLVAVKAEDQSLADLEREMDSLDLEAKAGKRTSDADQSRLQLVHDSLHHAHEHIKSLGAACPDGDGDGDDSAPMNGAYDDPSKSNRVPITAKALAEAVAKAIVGGNRKSSDKE